MKILFYALWIWVLLVYRVLFSGFSVQSWQLKSHFPLIKAPMQPLNTGNCSFNENIAKLSCIKVCRFIVTFIIQLLAHCHWRRVVLEADWVSSTIISVYFPMSYDLPGQRGSSHCQSQGQWLDKPLPCSAGVFLMSYVGFGRVNKYTDSFFPLPN